MDATIELVPSSVSTKRHLRRAVLAAYGFFVPVIVAFLWWIGVLGGNVREVVPGRFYRSAQLSGSTLENVLRRNGIRSLINLRGRSRKACYRSETAACRELGVTHYDVSFSSRSPKPIELQSLLDDLDHAPKPVMAHCEGGADRAGLAATLYENVYEGVPLDRAESEQLTWRSGCFPIFGSWSMDRFFELYRETSRGQSLRAWIVKSYPTVYVRAVAQGGTRT